jgi:flagellar biogenesis protein FliO
MGILGAGVVILFFITRWIKKGRPSWRGSQSSLQVLERRALSSKTTIYLLSVRGKGLVVAESSHGVQPLGEVSLEEATEPQEAASLARD